MWSVQRFTMSLSTTQKRIYFGWHHYGCAVSIFYQNLNKTCNDHKTCVKIYLFTWSSPVLFSDWPWFSLISKHSFNFHCRTCWFFTAPYWNKVTMAPCLVWFIHCVACFESGLWSDHFTWSLICSRFCYSIHFYFPHPRLPHGVPDSALATTGFALFSKSLK